MVPPLKRKHPKKDQSPPITSAGGSGRRCPLKLSLCRWTRLLYTIPPFAQIPLAIFPQSVRLLDLRRRDGLYCLAVAGTGKQYRREQNDTERTSKLANKQTIQRMIQNRTIQRELANNPTIQAAASSTKITMPEPVKCLSIVSSILNSS